MLGNSILDSKRFPQITKVWLTYLAKVTGSRGITVTIKYGVSIWTAKRSNKPDMIKENQSKIMIFKAEACAFYEGKCPVCMRAIELEDHIIGVEIDGQGHEWDCRTT